MEISEFMARIFKQVEKYPEWKIKAVIDQPHGEPLEPGFSWIEHGHAEDDPDLEFGWLFFKMENDKFLVVSFMNVPSARLR
ncbi:hypothetical protein [Pseudomonas sp. TMB3-21]